MGSYLATPVKDKESEDGVGAGGLRYGASAMQGWRVSQEDAHLSQVLFDTNAMLFAVFDGHGGAEVAKYSAMHLGQHIKSLESYRNGDYVKALEEGFLSFDELLRQPAVLEELKAIARNSGGKDDSESDSDNESGEDLETLLDEADAPLAELIERLDPESLQSLVQGRLDIQDRLMNLGNADGQSSDDEEEDGGTEEEDSENDWEDDEVQPEVAEEGSKMIETKAEPKVPLDHLNMDEEPASFPGGCTPLVEAPKLNGIGHTDEEPDNFKQPLNDILGKQTETTKSDTPQKKENAVKSVIIDDDAPGTSSGSGVSTNDDDDADNDFHPPNGEIDSDDDEDEEGENENMPAPLLRVGGARRKLVNGRSMFDFGDMGHVVVPGYDSGATANLALIKDGVLYVANVGDSRCVVCQNGSAFDMSRDHKPEDQEETDRINKAGGKVTSDGRVNNGLNLSRALGDHNYKRNESLDLSEQMICAKPDVKTLRLDDSHSFMVIACDGIWNSLNSQQVVNFVQSRLENNVTPLSKICEEMFDQVLAKNAGGDGTGMDNMTCIIVTFPKLPHRNGISAVAAEEEDKSASCIIKDEQPVSSPVSTGSQKRSADVADAENGDGPLASSENSVKKQKTAEEISI